MLSESLLPAVVELARDRMWRVRLAIIEYMPLLAKQLGPQYFNDYKVNDENLSKLSLSWLSDDVHAIRDAAAINLKNLAEVFGEEWANTNLLPEINRMRNSANYLYRLTTLSCCSLLAEALGAKATVDQLLPLVAQMAEDPVPNVRFNVSHTLKKLAPVLDAGTVSSKVKPLLQTMCEDQDPDVKYFAYTALQEIA